MRLKKAFIVLITSVTFGCALFQGAQAPTSPKEIFQTTEVAYTSALASAVDYARTCSAEPVVTESCDKFVVKVREVNDKAAVVLAVGGLVVAGVPQCDEAADPGCTSRLLLDLVNQLNQLIVQLKVGG